LAQDKVAMTSACFVSTDHCMDTQGPHDEEKKNVITKLNYLQNGQMVNKSKASECL